jgi:hypothetical protein
MGQAVADQRQQDAIHRVMVGIFRQCQPGLQYRLWDGSEGKVGQPDGSFCIVIRDPNTFRQALASGDTGRLATAFVEQRIDIQGDLMACLRIANQLEGTALAWHEKLRLWWLLRKI